MKKLLNWLVMCAVVTVFFGFVYGAAHLVLRQSANDPQIQIAEDAAHTLSSGGSVFTAVGAQPASVEISNSLETFYAIYDNSGMLIQSNASLNNLPAPKIPMGVLYSAKKSGEDRVTWQPTKDLRFAAVVVHFASSNNSGYVLAARSLKEVEDRAGTLIWLSFWGWLLCIAIITGKYIWQYEHRSTKKRK